MEPISITLGIIALLAALGLTGCADSDLENANLEEPVSIESRVSVLEDRADGLAEGEMFLLERIIDIEWEIINDINIKSLSMSALNYVGKDTKYWELVQEEFPRQLERIKGELEEDPDNEILREQIKILETKIEEHKEIFNNK